MMKSVEQSPPMIRKVVSPMEQTRRMVSPTPSGAMGGDDTPPAADNSDASGKRKRGGKKKNKKGRRKGR